jgi:hypothetical protein
MVNTMDDETRRYVPREFDPLARWREQAEQFAAEAEQGREEVRAEETRMRETPEAWSDWFVAQLRCHLMTYMQPHLDGIGEGVAELLGELHVRIKNLEQKSQAQRDEIAELKLENARLAIKISEARTDAVLAALPQVAGLRGAVN